MLIIFYPNIQLSARIGMFVGVAVIALVLILA